ncbi:MAG TPA: PspC family transcriptional regulator [Saprospiraceae bacterium]|nr:PspC family transcriptional regulator [Saprospiraceae bacterium]
MNTFKDILERSAFGVCAYIGEKIGIASSRVRLYFIYTTFATLGSPILFYLILAFWVNVRKYIKMSKKVLWN